MKFLNSILGGLAGAVALNILHETVKHIDHQAPRVDLVGEEGITKILKSLGAKPLQGNARYAAALAGDIVSNTLFYSLIGIGKKKALLERGITYGLSAGLAALTLTEPIGLSDAPVNRTEKTKALTVGYYLFGGLITALTIKALHKRRSKYQLAQMKRKLYAL